jgi:hypothetical protein
MVPLVVPPLATKSDYYDLSVLREEWQLARTALAEARRLVIMGYSAPMTVDLQIPIEGHGRIRFSSILAMLWNPYLEEWAAATGSRVRGWICCSRLGSDPSEHRMIACWRDDEDNRLQIRHHLSRKYAFGVPGNYALDCLARYEPLVEIGAGTGYWARCLRERGADIVAYDIMGDAWRSWFRPAIVLEIRRGGTRAIVARPHPQRAEPLLWTEVLQAGPEVLRRHAERTLLLC